MPASDRGPPGKTERLSAASLRILSGTASARPPPKAALFPTPKTTVSAVCACPLQNSTASLSPGLRRVHSGKNFAPPRCTGRKISRHFPLPPENKSHPFLFLPIGRDPRPSIFSAFSRHLLPGNGRPASPPFCRDGSRRHPPPACFPLKRQHAHISSARRKIGTRKTRLMMRRVSYFLSSRISREPP